MRARVTASTDMSLVAGLDFGGGAVKACVARVSDGEVIAIAARSTETSHPAPGRAEFEPAAWWSAARAAMREAVEIAARPADDYIAVTATSLRQGYVQIDDQGELGPGVLNSDRRGAPQLERVRTTIGADRLYETTGHWSAPQLTLPKLLQEQDADPERWARTECVLFVHDWALWRLSGTRCSEPSMASAGQLLDIRERRWAHEIMSDLGLDPAVLPPLQDAGTVAGELRDPGLGLPTGLPVLVGCGPLQWSVPGPAGQFAGLLHECAPAQRCLAPQAPHQTPAQLGPPRS